MEQKGLAMTLHEKQPTSTYILSLKLSWVKATHFGVFQFIAIINAKEKLSLFVTKCGGGNQA